METTLYEVVLELKEMVEQTDDITKMHAARLKVLRLGLEPETVCVLQANRALRNAILKVSGEKILLPDMKMSTEQLKAEIEAFRASTIKHFNRLLLVSHQVS